MFKKILVISICLFAFGCKSEKIVKLEVVEKLVESERYDDAITLSSEMIKKFPDVAGFYYERGWSNLSKGNNLDAKTDFENCIKIDQEYSGGYKGLASLALMEDRDDDAEFLYGKALSKEKNDEKKASILASLSYLAGKKNFDESIKLIDQAISLSDDGRFYDMKAKSYYDKGDKDLAFKILETGITKKYQENKFKSRSYYMLATISVEKGNKKQALDFIEKALDIEPTNPFYMEIRRRAKEI